VGLLCLWGFRVCGTLFVGLACLFVAIVMFARALLCVCVCRMCVCVCVCVCVGQLNSLKGFLFAMAAPQQSAVLDVYNISVVSRMFPPVSLSVGRGAWHGVLNANINPKP
jgi:hypothetical protein